VRERTESCEQNSEVQFHEYIVCFKHSDLLNLDIASKSDPQCQVFLLEREKNSWLKVGETEVLRHCFDFFFLLIQCSKTTQLAHSL
jgi:hypothetical protein